MYRLSSLFLLAIAVVLSTSVSAREFKSYKLKDPGDLTKNIFSNDVIELKAGDSLKFVNLITSSRDYAVLLVDFILDDEVNKILSYTSDFAHNFWEFSGPCKLKIGMNAISGNPRWLMCNVEITRANESQSKNVTGYSLVLPESKDNSYNLVLESSTDLVNWIEDKTGSKGPSEKKRFYRLRAVKE